MNFNLDNSQYYQQFLQFLIYKDPEAQKKKNIFNCLVLDNDKIADWNPDVKIQSNRYEEIRIWIARCVKIITIFGYFDYS